MITILNTSILTSYGSYKYEQVTTEQAKKAIRDGFISAVGHESTADIISTVLGVPVLPNRIMFQQNIGDVALVFKINGRAPEGKILSSSEIQEIGFQWGLLERLS